MTGSVHRGAVAVVALLGAAVPARAQDSVSVAPSGNCVLEWGAAPGGTAPALRHTQDESGAVADFFSGRTLFTCGTATMLADSAVSYETRGEVYLVGNVVYQDSVRSLESRLLSYYERDDLVIARDSVRLVRAADNSTLEGPYVEFLRAVSGIDELTTALGRPHMTLYPEGDDPGPPFDVDADRIVFAGEDEARGYGNVVIERDDMHGAADSIRLTRADEMGWMWGDPWIDAEDVRLEGDVISFRSEQEELKEIHSAGEGRAVGESFEIDAEVIDVVLENEEPRRVWAHGEGLSRALSGPHGVYGDSLEFAMFESAIDTVYSIGEAVAVQGEEPVAVSPDSATVPPDSTAVPPDSTVVPPDSMAAPPDSTVVPPDSMAVPPDSTVVGPDSTAVADALSDPGSAAPRDSLAIAESDSLAATPELVPDPLEIGREEDTTVDSLRVASDSAAVLTGLPAEEQSEDSAAVETEAPGDDPREGGQDVGSGEETPGEEDPVIVPGRIQPPRLRLDGDATWVTGDTLIAIFERPGADSLGVAEAGPLPVAIATSDPIVEPPATLAEGALAVGDSLEVVAGQPAAADSTSDPKMERLIVIGNARSYYSQIRDSTKTDRRTKNYMIGKRIDIYFEDGEPNEVTGVEAIGVFLDPEDDPSFSADPAGSETPPGELPVGPAEGGVSAPDSTGTVPDPLAVPTDSTAVPDSTAAPPDTTSAPPDTTGRRIGTTAASAPPISLVERPLPARRGPRVRTGSIPMATRRMRGGFA
ncbi:MAG: hypothetical protein OEU54_05900 [Gemmatimonadota bacterium]|nr:hypothetical protein [Gemmatimonadota bacterium]